jgi:hypothetical protein
VSHLNISAMALFHQSALFSSFSLVLSYFSSFISGDDVSDADIAQQPKQAGRNARMKATIKKTVKVKA